MKYILLAIIFITPNIFAGSGMGGGTPPALADLDLELMQAEPGRAGLFDNGFGDVGLLTQSTLPPKLRVKKIKALSASLATGNSLILPEADFNLLRDRTKPLDVVNRDNGNASYSVEAGDTIDSVILQDRREAVRAALAK